MYAMQETGLTCMRNRVVCYAGNRIDVYAMQETGLTCMLCGKHG